MQKSAALHADFGKPPFEQLFEISVPTGVIHYYRGCRRLRGSGNPDLDVFPPYTGKDIAKNLSVFS